MKYSFIAINITLSGSTYSMFVPFHAKVRLVFVLMRLEFLVVPMMTVVFVGCSSNIVCGIHHSVLAMAQEGGLDN